MKLKSLVLGGLTAAAVSMAIPAAAQELKIALIAGKTGALEAYAKETEIGFMMGLEYLTKGSMTINGRKVKVIVKDDQGKPLAHRMAAHGWVVVSANYRLSPRFAWPDHIVDVKAAIRWIKEHGAEYGADPDFIAITGGSAGGHLAALAAILDGVVD